MVEKKVADSINLENNISLEYCKGIIGKNIKEEHASIILIYDDGDATVYYNTYQIQNNIKGTGDGIQSQIRLGPDLLIENYQQTIARNEFYIGDYENFAKKVMTEFSA